MDHKRNASVDHNYLFYVDPTIVLLVNTGDEYLGKLARIVLRRHLRHFLFINRSDEIRKKLSMREIHFFPKTYSPDDPALVNGGYQWIDLICVNYIQGN